MTDSTPRVLAGRYEVGELIGRGGMAEVHIGHDARLGRTVAIKILRSDLARDPSFLARFRREAQAAAALNHPSIVAVYDTGEDVHTDPTTGAQVHIPFIVMEYIEGHTVREILKHGTAVPIDEAVQITIGVLSALEYSHHAGIIHRDIKPANIMITPNGAVKVMDFGIARAVADAAMTQTQAVIGTAQYLSPEQARGEQVDARSDIYSAGCVLFELLTGRPPFIGDSPVAVAYQHVGEEPTAPSQIASDVPPELDRICLKALAKSKDERYASAAEFRADLERFLAGEHHLTTPLAVAEVPIDGEPDLNATQVLGSGATTVLNPLAPTEVLNQGVAATQLLSPNPAATTVMASQQPVAATTVMAPQQPLPPVQQFTPPPSIAQQPYPTNSVPVVAPKKSKAWLWVLLPLLLAGIGFVVWRFIWPTTEDLVTVPTLQPGVTQAVAQQTIEAANLRFRAEIDEESELPEGEFVRQDPEGGEEVPAQTEVTAWFSGGPNTITMPDLTDQTQTQALTTLADLGLVAGTIEPENHPTIVRDNITRTEPAADTIVNIGDTVNLWVSDGQVELPNMIGWPQAQAQTALSGLNLTANINQVEDGSVEPGTVLSHNPSAGPIDQGSQVTLNVAEAPEVQMTSVPNIVGLTWNAQTQSFITGAGLQFDETWSYSDTVPSGAVIATNPGAGAQVESGSTVIITISRGPEQVEPPAPPAPPVDPGPGPEEPEPGGDEAQEPEGDEAQPATLPFDVEPSPGVAAGSGEPDTAGIS